jgi:heme/copper-type cytochrome/quinol oxidase subunit 1
MTRAGVITAHIGALPVAILLAVLAGLAFPGHRAADLQLHDTFFVVAHFHTTVVLAVTVLVATVVAYRYGAINLAIIVAWPLLVIHFASSFLRETIGGLYSLTALACFLAVVVGMVISLWRSVRRRESTWSA